ncbi:MAG: class I SAM-dependent methyltransferase [Blastocatellia bacterium]|nr:class I SAM-dependent methyltransferase [Blastocatellia bacterium]
MSNRHSHTSGEVPDLPYGSIAVGYDDGMRFFERRLFGHRRRKLIPQASGNVLEIGGGTGVNLQYYQGLASLVLTDPDPLMIEQAERKLRPGAFPVRFEVVSAEALPFPDGSFDTVVATLVFCTIPQPAKALAEIRRVLRPGGKFLFMEHVRPRPFPLGLLADVLTPLQKRLCGGCQLNRKTLETVEAAGFQVVQRELSRFDLILSGEAILSHTEP